MDSHPQPERRAPEPQVYLAAERTFLAWIRTGLALMGFGFVVARFGLFLQAMYTERAHSLPAPGLSVRFGTALVVLGVVLTAASVVRYVRLLGRLANGETLIRPSRLAVLLGLTLTLIGSAVSLYLLLAP